MPHTIHRTPKVSAYRSKVPQVGCHCVPLTAWRTPVRYLYSAEVDSPRYALVYNDADGNVDLDDDANFDDVFVLVLGFQGSEYPGTDVELCPNP